MTDIGRTKGRNKRVRQIGAIIVLIFLCAVAAVYLAWRVNSDANPGISDAVSAGDVATSIAECSDEPMDAAVEEIRKYVLADHVYPHGHTERSDEHTFEAYDAALAAGAHYVEPDVVISRDGTLYVSHDLDAARITGDGRYYAAMSDAEIDELRGGTGEPIHRLSEVFDRYGRSVKYLVELKSADDGTVDAFRSDVDERGIADLIVLQSEFPEVLEKSEAIYPDMPKMLIVKNEAAFNLSISADYIDIVGARVQFMTQGYCDAAHDAGRKFVGWPIDSEDEIINAIRIGADAYFTNDTPLALEMESKYRKLNIRVRKPGEALATILFASDYQAEDGFGSPKDTLSAVVRAAKADGKTADMAVLCGDYTNDSNLHDYQLSGEDAISEIEDTVKNALNDNAQTTKINDNNQNSNKNINKSEDAGGERSKDKSAAEILTLFVQGNHDAMTESIAASGLHEYDDYLIYVLNTEEDFPWKQGKVSGSLDKVRASAASMKETLDGLIARGETRPVFIAGHVPLHFTARTSSRHTTGDNLYSSLIFDVVNEAAGSLDIIYLFGHNHSKGWDCYLGGACVYKAIGDELLIPSVSGASDSADNNYETLAGAVNTDSFKAETLNFTYLNAGYVGYYMNSAPEDYSSDADSLYRAADETLTCTVAEVYKDRIVLTRYDKDGAHAIGSAGEANPYKGGIDQGIIGSEHYSHETQSPATIPRKTRDSRALDNAA